MHRAKALRFVLILMGAACFAGEPGVDMPALIEQAESGDAEAQYKLGLMYGDEREAVYNPELALRWMLEAAEQGHVEAAYQCGYFYSGAMGVQPDPEKRAHWFEQAARAGHALAQHGYAETFVNRPLHEREDAKAVEWFRKAAEQGVIWSQLRYARYLTEGKWVEADPAEAARVYRDALAQHDHREAAYGLGHLYEQGLGVEQDYDEAVRLYRKAALMHPDGSPMEFPHDPSRPPHSPGPRPLPRAFTALGRMHEQGLGVAQDHAEAVRLYEAAAAQRDEDAMQQLMRVHADGIGVERDVSEAARWAAQVIRRKLSNEFNILGFMLSDLSDYPPHQADFVRMLRLAADDGEAWAQSWLAGFYEHGRGVDEDKDEALRLTRAAADQEYFLAQYAMGLHYRAGERVPKDDEKAFAYFQQALESMEAGKESAAGHEGGMDSLDWSDLPTGIYLFDAIRWFQRAAERGEVMPLACLSRIIGVFHQAPDGEESLLLSYKYFLIAEARGFRFPTEMRESYGEQLSAETMREAQRRADEWMARFPQ